MSSLYFPKLDKQSDRNLLIDESHNQTRPFTPQGNRRKSNTFVDPRTFIKPEKLEYKYQTKDETANNPSQKQFSFQNLYETPQQYIDALSQRIPLGDLYQVKDCYCDNAANEYCAVTVEVKDPNIRKILGIKEDDRILKVFNKSGDLVYQRTVAPIDKEHIKKATN